MKERGRHKLFPQLLAFYLVQKGFGISSEKVETPDPFCLSINLSDYNAENRICLVIECEWMG